MSQRKLPRYRFVQQKLCEFIVEQKISTLPVDPFKLIEKNKWGLVSYRDLAASAGMNSVDEMILTSCSADGFTIYNGKNYCIAYNSDVKVFAKIVFTLMKEIGHIYLAHLSTDRGHELSEQEYAVLEAEAEYFADGVLAPSVVIKKCGLTTAESLAYTCGMTCEAAQKRLKQFKKWKPSELDGKVFGVLNEYIRYGMQLGAGYSPVDVWCEEIRLALAE